MQPTFKAIAEAGVEGASFAEVECRQSQPLCQKYKAGEGGWPTLVTFTAQTRLKGAPYPRKQPGMVCDELKVEANMRGHVEATLAASKAAAATAAAGAGGGAADAPPSPAAGEL